MTNVKIKNMKDLIVDLSTVYGELRAEKINLPQAKGIADTASKLIKAASTQLAYNSHMGDKKKIAFFE